MKTPHLLTAAAACVLLTAALTTAAGARPAAALPCAGWPQCSGGAGTFQVSGTPDNDLEEWTYSPSRGGVDLGHRVNGDSLWIICQANDGPQEDSKFNAPNVPSTTWDYVYDPARQDFVWVYDWWMNTPPQNQADNWYSFSATSLHCNFGSSGTAAKDLINRIVGMHENNGTGLAGFTLEGMTDAAHNRMDTMKILRTDTGAYLAVYHNNDTPDGQVGVWLATSTDLRTWDPQVVLDEDASQPFLAEEHDHSYVLADEAGTGGASNLRFIHFANYPDLIQGIRDDTFNAARSVGSCFAGLSGNEGTPDIHGISADDTSISVGFHYIPPDTTCNGPDQEAFGTLTNFLPGQTTSWSATVDTVRNNATNAAGYPQKHGAREDISWHGFRFSLQEAQLQNSDINGTAGFQSWRLSLYDYQTHTVYPVPLITQNNSQCFANPSIYQTTDPSTGKPVLTVGTFLFSECLHAGDTANEWFYTVPAQ